MMTLDSTMGVSAAELKAAVDAAEEIVTGHATSDAAIGTIDDPTQATEVTIVDELTWG